MTALLLEWVGKSYRHYRHPRDRFWELLTHRIRHREQVALHPVHLQVKRGEVIGLIGVNGAGKSTLLKLIAGTLKPSTGQLTTQGRICALLELGAGFHPEMTGRENIHLGGAVAGLPGARIRELEGSIIDFAGIRAAIDQPVKTYSSGMAMRLAFAVATAVDPDILILDETLSVGDGRFAKKSFDRIMRFKDAGKTILFCSHSMYQVQAVCSRVWWLDGGHLRMDGDPAEVISAYTDHMTHLDQPESGEVPSMGREIEAGAETGSPMRLLKAEVVAGGNRGSQLAIESGETDVEVVASFTSDPAAPPPVVAVVIIGAQGHPVTSATTQMDGWVPERRPDGAGSIKLTFPALPLLKGSYWVHVFLLCDRGIHVHDKARMIAELVVRQRGLEIGLVSLPRRWGGVAAAAAGEPALPGDQ